MSKYPIPDREFICACAICEHPIYEDEDLTKHDIFYENQLEHTEIAHARCAPGWVPVTNWRKEA